jgi:hypothetical protein
MDGIHNTTLRFTFPPVSDRFRHCLRLLGGFPQELDLSDMAAQASALHLDVEETHQAW